MAKIMILLKDTERDALVILARNEFRDPRTQARLVIVRELERAGLIQPENTSGGINKKEVTNVQSTK
jgi:hypothetical protein